MSCILRNHFTLLTGEHVANNFPSAAMVDQSQARSFPKNEDVIVLYLYPSKNQEPRARVQSSSLQLAVMFMLAVGRPKMVTKMVTKLAILSTIVWRVMIGAVLV